MEFELREGKQHSQCNFIPILRFIGQLGLTREKSPVRHPAKRRRIRTVMQELMCLAARLVKTAHRLKIVFSRYCPGFKAFKFRILVTDAAIFNLAA